MSTGEIQGRREQISLSLHSILDISERWLRYLRKRQRQVRIARSLLTGMLVGIGLTAVTIVYLVTQYSPAYFAQNHELVLTLLASIALIGVITGAAVVSGAIAYLLLNRRLNPRLEELSSLIDQMKNQNDSQGATESALSLAEKIITLLPEVVRRRNQDALLFGIVAFLVTLIVPHSPPITFPIAILVGVIVWLYFRYELSKTYDREISRFEEQRRIFELRKKEFIESL